MFAVLKAEVYRLLRKWQSRESDRLRTAVNADKRRGGGHPGRSAARWGQREEEAPRARSLECVNKKTEKATTRCRHVSLLVLALCRNGAGKQPLVPEQVDSRSLGAKTVP